MKTNESRMFALIGAAVCSFFFGLGQQEVPAQVRNCVNSCCEMPYAWWTSQFDLSAQVRGATFPFGAGQNTTTAIPSIWVPAATSGGCALANVGTYGQWSWSTATASCQTAGGAYPAPQGVTPGGTATLVNRGVNRLACVPGHNP